MDENWREWFLDPAAQPPAMPGQLDMNAVGLLHYDDEHGSPSQQAQHPAPDNGSDHSGHGSR